MKKIIYALFDVLTLKKGIVRNINGYRIRLSPQWSRYYERDYEQDNFNFISVHVKPGYTVLDIGAHIGLYTSVFGQLTGGRGKVLALEPTPSTFKILERTRQLNNTANNITVLNNAVSDHNGEVVFNLTTADGEGSNANSIVQVGSGRDSVRVQCITIDELKKKAGRKIDFIKIDVEGAELLALKGGENVFKTDRPTGTIGLHPELIMSMGHTLAQIWDCMSGYDLLVIYENREVTKEWFCAQTNLFDVQFLPR